MSKEVRDSGVGDAPFDRELGHSRSTEIVQEKHAPRHPLPLSRSTARSIAIVATCTAAMVVNVSNSTSVSISLPDIGKAIDIEEDQLQWLLSAYSLSSGCLLLFFGRLADLYGRKKAFMIGMLWQMVFAVGCGFSTNGFTLDILRAFQGMGAAAAIPSALGILAHSFPPSRARSLAFATFAAGAPVGAAFGTVVGGVLTQLTPDHWRATFFLSGGLSALCFLGGLTSFDADKVSSEIDRRVDWIGASLVTSGLVLIVFVLGQGPIAGWQSPYIIALLIIGVILVGIFLVWENHLEKALYIPNKPKSIWTPPPLMKLSLWARAKGRMAVILAIAFLNWSGFLCWTFWVQLYYQNYLGLSPVHTMVRFIPMFVMGCLCNFFVAMVVSRLPLVVFVVSGTLITASACVLFALINPAATYWAFGFPSTILVVFGADFVYSAGTIFIAKIALPHEQSVFGALFQTMTQIGTAFGLTVSTIVFNSVVEKESAKLGVTVNSTGTNAPQSAELLGYRAAQWTGSGFPILAAILALIFLRGVGIVGHRRHDVPPQDADSERTLTVQRSEQTLAVQRRGTDMSNSLPPTPVAETQV
ncbi:the Drug:H+ antiporter-2 family [Paxillus involutus ATCC 200175]|uniref:The Drug:H+ antiporter-2 family n=1 Tax=Paxillus involutus ATCC 200175 TaxID=664439 RepID=A0A0C9TLK0_PAXIN|nr:the Drug:H+ antiporter-2 family [Paxillus involutus ATCC 200175]